MVEDKKIKLQSGREVVLKPLKFRQRAKLKDLALKFNTNGIPISLDWCGDAVIAGVGISEDDLEAWDDNEIYECGAQVLNTMFIPEETKKK